MQAIQYSAAMLTEVACIDTSSGGNITCLVFLDGIMPTEHIKKRAVPAEECDGGGTAKKQARPSTVDEFANRNYVTPQDQAASAASGQEYVVTPTICREVGCTVNAMASALPDYKKMPVEEIDAVLRRKNDLWNLRKNNRVAKNEQVRGATQTSGKMKETVKDALIFSHTGQKSRDAVIKVPATMSRVKKCRYEGCTNNSKMEESVRAFTVQKEGGCLHIQSRRNTHNQPNNLLLAGRWLRERSEGQLFEERQQSHMQEELDMEIANRQARELQSKIQKLETEIANRHARASLVQELEDELSRRLIIKALEDELSRRLASGITYSI